MATTEGEVIEVELAVFGHAPCATPDVVSHYGRRLRRICDDVWRDVGPARRGDAIAIEVLR